MKTSEQYPAITNVIKDNMHIHDSSEMIKLISQDEKAKEELIKELHDLRTRLLSDKNIENRVLAIMRTIREEVNNV